MSQFTKIKAVAELFRFSRLIHSILVVDLLGLGVLYARSADPERRSASPPVHFAAVDQTETGRFAIEATAGVAA